VRTADDGYIGRMSTEDAAAPAGDPAVSAEAGAPAGAAAPAEEPAAPAEAAAPAEEPAVADEAGAAAEPVAPEEAASPVEAAQSAPAGGTGARRIGRAGSYSKGIARRQEILDRAIGVFRERGADGTSLRRIAGAIGVSHGALLHYFSSREELLVAVYEHAEHRRDLDKEDEGRERAVDVMANAALANLEVPGLVQLYSTLVATSLEAEAGPATEYFTARFERVRGDLEQRLREDQASGLVRADVDPARTAALIVAASDGLQIQWLLEPTIELQETLETFAVLLAP